MLDEAGSPGGHIDGVRSVGCVCQVEDPKSPTCHAPDRKSSTLRVWLTRADCNEAFDETENYKMDMPDVQQCY